MSSHARMEGKFTPAISSVLPCLSNQGDLTLSGDSVGEASVDTIESSSDGHLVLRACMVPCLEPFHVLEHQAAGDVQCWQCKRWFRGTRGLRIHISKSRCSQAVEESEVNDRSPVFEQSGSAFERSSNSMSTVVPESGVQTCEFRVPGDSSESHFNTRQHSTEEEIAKLQGGEEISRIRWPSLKEDSRWESLESRVKGQIPSNIAWTVRLELLQSVIYTEAVELFGCIQPGVVQGRRRNRRENELMVCRVRIRRLWKRLKDQSLSVEERCALEGLHDDWKQKRNGLRRAENARKRRKERRRVRKSFYQDPFKTAKEMLSPHVPTKLEVGKEVLDEYVRGVSSDPDREVDLGELPGLPEVSSPVVELNRRPFTPYQFRKILRRKRSFSRPGPNQIPYAVYKKCPWLFECLLDIMNAASRANGKDFPLCWRVSDGVMIPKVASPKSDDIGDFRQIALLNVEGKLF